MKLLPYPAASHPSGTIHFKGQELLGLPEHEIRKVRGNDITIIFQEPMTSLNPLHTIEKQIGEILLTCTAACAGEAARERIDRTARRRSAFPIRRRGSRAIRTSSPAASASA